MEVVKNFIGWGVCFALALAVITAWPLLKRVGSGFEAGVNNLDFAIGLAGYERRMKSSGLNEPMDDPEDIAGEEFREEVYVFRRASDRQKSQRRYYRGQWFETSTSFRDGCLYDDTISMYWCVSD